MKLRHDREPIHNTASIHNGDLIAKAPNQMVVENAKQPSGVLRHQRAKADKELSHIAVSRRLSLRQPREETDRPPAPYAAQPKRTSAG